MSSFRCRLARSYNRMGPPLCQLELERGGDRRPVPQPCHTGVALAAGKLGLPGG